MKNADKDFLKNLELFHSNFMLKDSKYLINIDLIQKILVNINSGDLIEICKCMKKAHKKCFLIYIIYIGKFKCRKCTDYYELKFEDLLNIKDKLLLEGIVPYILYLFVFGFFIFANIFLLNGELKEHYLHLKYFFSLFFNYVFFCVINIFN